MLETLLVFVGIPLLVVLGISLLVMAPSLAKGPRFGPGQPWEAEPEWFGAPEAGGLEAAPPRPQLVGSAHTGGAIRAEEGPASGRGSGSRGSGGRADGDTETGGASVRW